MVRLLQFVILWIVTLFFAYVEASTIMALNSSATIIRRDTTCVYDHDNRAAAAAALSVGCATLVWMLADIAVLFWDYRADHPVITIGKALNSLGAVLGITSSVVYAFATWPQPIEIGGFLVLLVGQVSSLGWNRYIEDALNSQPQTAARGRGIVLTEALLDKVPDLGGVVAAAWGAWMPGQTFKIKSGNGFQRKHDPLYYGIGASIFAGVAALLSLTMLCFPPSAARRVVALLYWIFNIGAGIVAASWCLKIVRTDFCGLYQAAGAVIAIDLILGSLVSLAYLYKSMTSQVVAGGSHQTTPVRLLSPARPATLRQN